MATSRAHWQRAADVAIRRERYPATQGDGQRAADVAIRRERYPATHGDWQRAADVAIRRERYPATHGERYPTIRRLRYSRHPRRRAAGYGRIS